jgi:hypothetical protein
LIPILDGDDPLKRLQLLLTLIMIPLMRLQLLWILIMIPLMLLLLLLLMMMMMMMMAVMVMIVERRLIGRVMMKGTTEGFNLRCRSSRCIPVLRPWG